MVGGKTFDHFAFLFEAGREFKVSKVSKDPKDLKNSPLPKQIK